eukprot:1150051-Pelagomonas_calceolata.AAC.2
MGECWKRGRKRGLLSNDHAFCFALNSGCLSALECLQCAVALESQEPPMTQSLKKGESGH